MENGIIFFLTPSSYSSEQRRKYSIFTVITSLSPFDLQTRNPIKSCWTPILRNTDFLSTQPPQTPAWPWLAKQYINRCGVLYLPLFLPSWNSTRTVFHPPFSVPTTSCSQPQGCPSRALPPSPAQAGTSKASSLNTREMSFCHFSGLLASQAEREKLTYPYLIKINVTSDTTQRCYYPTESSRKEKNPISFILSISAKICNSF